MSIFERYLTAWVFACILVGIAAGQIFPAVFQSIGQWEVARVNLPVGLLIWVMIIPMLMKVDFSALREVRRHVRGIGVTLFVNWLVKPFSMALLAWIFVRHLFVPWLPALMARQPGGARWLKVASASIERHELPVQRKRTFMRVIRPVPWPVSSCARAAASTRADTRRRGRSSFP